MCSFHDVPYRMVGKSRKTTKIPTQSFIHHCRDVVYKVPERSALNLWALREGLLDFFDMCYYTFCGWSGG